LDSEDIKACAQADFAEDAVACSSMFIAISILQSLGTFVVYNLDILYISVIYVTYTF